MSDKDTAADSAASADDRKLIKLDQHYEQSTDSESIVRSISLAITLLCSFSATVLSYRRLESSSYERTPSANHHFGWPSRRLWRRRHSWDVQATLLLLAKILHWKAVADIGIGIEVTWCVHRCKCFFCMRHIFCLAFFYLAPPKKLELEGQRGAIKCFLGREFLM